MTSTYLPVLKVDENELQHNENEPGKNVLVSSTYISLSSQCNWNGETQDSKPCSMRFDYQTRNTLKTKQRRLDPYYRSQERVRQRAVMRIKRQDPRFREEEREKGRYRMRLKRLDPVFRSQERERQRERMKMKRSDPEFREKEREQQKSRMHEKRLDPVFREKEHSKLCSKKQNCFTHSTINSSSGNKPSHKIDTDFITVNQTLKNNLEICDSVSEGRSNQSAFPDNITSKVLSLKSRDSALEAFHFKKQQILNFNFYNTLKDEWAAHEELYSKAIAHFGFNNKNDTLKLQPCVSGPISSLKSDSSKIPQNNLPTNEIDSEALVPIKAEEVQIEESQKQNAHEESISTDRFTASGCIEK